MDGRIRPSSSGIAFLKISINGLIAEQGPLAAPHDQKWDGNGSEPDSSWLGSSGGSSHEPARPNPVAWNIVSKCTQPLLISWSTYILP